MLVNKQFGCIKIFANPDEADGNIFFSSCKERDQAAVFLRDVVEQDNYVILSYSGLKCGMIIG